ncbi:MAG: cobyric acid synthase [Pseudomonadota bacterium]
MRRSVKTIMFLGTGSDVGKSIVATAFCRILKRRGFTVAPFKAQNMSNNSYVTLDGGEIGRAQVVQAEAAGLRPTADMNPILLKPSSQLGAQVVVQGRVFRQMQAAEYHHYKKHLARFVMESFQRLASKYEVMVMEGAGSCAEVNLKANDLVNFALAKKVSAPCVLVADIDRGGVFAQVIGSLALMSRREKELTAGFIINKFRGDPELFRDGLEFIERRTRRPVFGLAPFYEDIFIDPEDSVAVQPDRRPVLPLRPDKISVAVIKLPGLSNFTDMEALEREPDVMVNYLSRPCLLKAYDLLILPGTKNSMEDAVWLHRQGWAKLIKDYAHSGGTILGLCGGYQLLGQEISDPLGVESSRGRVRGLGLLPATTTLAGDKILRKVTGVDLLSGQRVQGYEIHMGRTIKKRRAINSPEARSFLKIRHVGSGGFWEDGLSAANGRISGAYVHGLLDSPGWRRDFLNQLRRAKGLAERRRSAPSRGGRFHQYDKLAEHFERHTDVAAILKIMGV